MSKVFAILVGRLSQSPDAVVRAASSSALGLLIKRSNVVKTLTPKFDRADSSQNFQHGDTRTKTSSEPQQETIDMPNDTQREP